MGEDGKEMKRVFLFGGKGKGKGEGGEWKCLILILILILIPDGWMDTYLST